MVNLGTPVSQLTRIGQSTAKRLNMLGLRTAEDLLYYYPFRYDDFSKILTIAELKTRNQGTIKGKIKLIANRRSPRKKMILTEAIVSDQTDSIKVIWFNQPFLIKVLKPGQEVYLAGRVEDDEQYGLELLNPSYEIFKGKAPIHTGRLVPVYPTTQNLSQKQLRYLIRSVLPLAQQIEDWLPRSLRVKYSLLNLVTAIEQIHFPQDKKWLERAAHRLKFDELFLIQLQTQLIRQEIKKQRAPALELKLAEIQKFVASLPFKLTDAQRKSGWEILKDLEKPEPMNRLLEGDVGSGKTVVATMAILNTILNGYQVAYLAPTEILSKQHFETITSLLRSFPIKIGLLTRTQIQINQDERLSKKDLLQKIAEGEIDLVIGTHALIQEGVKFSNLALVIVDEQHRFGVEQRAKLSRDPKNPNTSELSEKKDKIIEKDLSYKLYGIFFEIQKEIDRFCREKQYADLLAQKLKQSGLVFQREYPIEIGGIKSNFVDFIVENKILIDLKAKPFIEKTDYYQMVRYLEAANLELGLIVNFRQKHLKPKRVLNPKFKPKEKFGTFGCNSGHSGRYTPHFLSMTATPIPRSLALTLYGDLDLSIIDQMPKGRKKVMARIIRPEEVGEAYQFIEEEIKNGRQAFIICPLIDPSDKLGVKSVKQEYKKISEKIFPHLKIGLLHGRMKGKEKEKIRQEFLENKIQILISTTVVEVGIDVPNASVMMIEGAERFGLAQLYQLQGRVGRSHHQSYCFLFLESESGRAKQRLKALLTAQNGFELAEMDLKMRGPGEIYGTEQAGYLDSLKIARLTDVQIIKEAQEATQQILTEDPDLKNYPALKEKITKRKLDLSRLE